jgi:hypothetical protein
VGRGGKSGEEVGVERVVAYRTRTDRSVVFRWVDGPGIHRAVSDDRAIWREEEASADRTIRRGVRLIIVIVILMTEHRIELVS